MNPKIKPIPPAMHNQRFISTTDLAKLLGVELRVVQMRIKNGLIFPAYKVGRTWLVDRNYIDIPVLPQGRPKGSVDSYRRKRRYQKKPKDVSNKIKGKK